MCFEACGVKIFGLFMNYREWLQQGSSEITGDPLWTVEADRLSWFAADVSWADVTKRLQDKRTIDPSNQLYRAVGSMGANISEGFSRGSGRDRARFDEYSLGSASESRTWYFNGRYVLGETVASHRRRFLTQIIRLLLVMIPDQRGAPLREEEPAHQISDGSSLFQSSSAHSLDEWLEKIPMS